MHRSKVLVVDDSLYDRSMLTAALHSLNIKDVVHAVNGVDAISQFKEGLRPDYVFLDIHMPIVDGYEVLSWLQDMRMDESLKIFIYSDNYRAGNHFDCIKKGLRSDLVRRVKRIFNDLVYSGDYA